MESTRSVRAQGHRRSISFDRVDRPRNRNRSNSVLRTRSHTQAITESDPTTTSAKVSHLDFSALPSDRSYSKISHRYFTDKYDDIDSPRDAKPRVFALPPKPVKNMTVEEYESLIDRKRQIFSNANVRAQSAESRLTKETRRKNMLKNRAIFSRQRENVPEFDTEPKYATDEPRPISTVQFADLCVFDPKHNSKPSIPRLHNYIADINVAF